MTAQEMNAWLHYGGGLELWQELYEPYGVIPMAGGNTGAQMGGWFNKEINTLADLKGLKMRLPGFAADVAEAGGWYSGQFAWAVSCLRRLRPVR